LNDNYPHNAQQLPLFLAILMGVLLLLVATVLLEEEKEQKRRRPPQVSFRAPHDIWLLVEYRPFGIVKELTCEELGGCCRTEWIHLLSLQLVSLLVVSSISLPFSVAQTPMQHALSKRPCEALAARSLVAKFVESFS
jgi:hypothetical protein